MCLLEEALKLKPGEQLEYFLGQSLAIARTLTSDRGRDINRIAAGVYRLATARRGKKPTGFVVVQKKMGKLYSHRVIRY